MTARAQPDPDRGVFETLLVLDGEPVELGAHLDRLSASLATLYAADLPAGAERLVRDAAVGLDHGRLRLTATPRADGAALSASARETDRRLTFPAPEAGAELRSHALPGGLGPHKWVDRRALPPQPPGTTPLLVEEDGEVLEAAWANIFAVRGGTLVTPPPDGRLLPGVTRARAIELAREIGLEVRERAIGLEQLRDADEVLLTNAVRGVEPVRALDGAPLSRDGAIGAALAEALRARWRTGAPVLGG
jgi:para-aminobenzoate synthetase/4-amino-4-deoxychorismate lyase